jgi:hypothetical protein
VALLNNPTLQHHRHIGAETANLGEVMGDQDHGQAILAEALVDEVFNTLYIGRIQVSGGLIQKQDTGTGKKSPHKGYASRFSGGESMDPGLGKGAKPYGG